MEHSFTHRFLTLKLDTLSQRFSASNLLQKLGSASLSLGLVMASGLSVTAAETLSAKYAQFELELTVSELQAYAESNQRSPLIETLDILLEEDQRSQVKGALTRKFVVYPEVLARFFSTPSGYRVLEDLTDVIQAKSKSVDSVLALRTAVILDASEDNVVTLLSLLRAFPDAGVKVDVARGLKVFERLTAEVEAHETAIASIKERSSSSIELPSRGLATQYSRSGPYRWDKQSFNLRDERPIRLQVSGEPRILPLDLYLPRRYGKAPVIILSHGLGSGRTAYEYFAKHLASYGYAVAVPEHPGSSFRHWRSLLENETNVIASPQEFLNRPLDIQHILDVLTQKNEQDWRFINRLDLDKIGMFGHSYGGYTALAIAGAKLDLENLKQSCGQDLATVFNPSLLLQCQATELPSTLPDLSDPRVKAVFVTHPILSAVIGSQGLSSIKVPITVVAGGADRIAPLVAEQVTPYGAITASPDRTFVLVERADHFSQVGEISPQETVLEPSEERPNPINLKARQTLKTLGLAFFQSHLNPRKTPETSLLTLVRSLNEPSFPVYGLVGFEDAWASTLPPKSYEH